MLKRKPVVDSDLARLARAALKRDSEACFRLGRIYYEGKRVRKNEPAARALFERAARAGHIQARNEIERLWGALLVHISETQATQQAGGLTNISSASPQEQTPLTLLTGVEPEEPSLTVIRGGSASAPEPVPVTVISSSADAESETTAVTTPLPEPADEPVVISCLPAETELPPQPDTVEQEDEAEQQEDDALPAALPAAESPDSGPDDEDPAVWYARGWKYANGKDVEQDMEAAVMWYTKAAERDYIYAQMALANCLREGRGIMMNPAQSARWYGRAAEQGFADAACNMGWCFGTGYGVAKDYAQAFSWYDKACLHGHAIAAKNRQALQQEIQNRLRRESLPLNNEAVSAAADGTLEYYGQKCAIYIPRQHRGLVDKGQQLTQYTYHLCLCRGMMQMDAGNRWRLYAATARDDGRFEVFVLESATGDGGSLFWKPHEFTVTLCGNCERILKKQGLYPEPFTLKSYYAQFGAPAQEIRQQPVTLSYMPTVVLH